MFVCPEFAYHHDQHGREDKEDDHGENGDGRDFVFAHHASCLCTLSSTASPSENILRQNSSFSASLTSPALPVTTTPIARDPRHCDSSPNPKPIVVTVLVHQARLVNDHFGKTLEVAEVVEDHVSGSLDRDGLPPTPESQNDTSPCVASGPIASEGPSLPKRFMATVRHM